MTSPERPYRFPALPDDEQATRTRCTTQSCGTWGASAVANCVALCCCPCAVVSCLTLALVKAPYVAGRRCVVRLARRRQLCALRNARRVRDLDEKQQDQLGDAAPRRSKECAELAGAVIVGAEGRAKVSSREDAADKVWVEMYKVGLWGFGRLSFSATGGGGDCEKDGDDAAE
ncbi:uncharacterized protein LOC133908342 [Phragmites australis]|uniref:uncharacterized protein LOC133908342 n=1 Tax=Phragmites australis TaxID=29695 RepID=UPI002D7767B1|nr:uncharacterized protein LOC133908342 [Phragmites australis]